MDKKYTVILEGKITGPYLVTTYTLNEAKEISIRQGNGHAIIIDLETWQVVSD